MLQEEYIRRSASRAEIEYMLQNPKLVEAAGEQLRKYFSSEELDPRRRRA